MGNRSTIQVGPSVVSDFARCKLASKLALQEAIATSVHTIVCMDEAATNVRLERKGCPEGRMVAWCEARAGQVTRSGPGC